MKSKYEPLVMDILSTTQLKSTNTILTELEEQHGNKVNWHLLYRVLSELHVKNKVEKMDTKSGFFWRKK